MEYKVEDYDFVFPCLYSFVSPSSLPPVHCVASPPGFWLFSPLTPTLELTTPAMAGRKRAASPSASRSPSPSAEKQPRFHFPSVRRNEPLIDSYTYHSVDAEREQAEGQAGAGEDANEVEEKRDVEGEWMLGVDEAGRGPALGESAVQRTRKAVLQAKEPGDDRTEPS